jgi:BRCT domain type II-containing protein
LDGVPTTHYRTNLDLTKKSGVARAASRALLKQLGGRITDETAVPTNIWVDSWHHVRQMSFTMDILVKRSIEPIVVTTKLDISDYGPQTQPTPPPASETLDLLALLKAESHGTTLSS